MNSFLNAADMELLKQETGNHSCCDLCQKACNCEGCSLLCLEQIFNAPPLEDVESDIDSDVTEEYNLSDYEDAMLCSLPDTEDAL